LSTLECKCK